MLISNTYRELNEDLHKRNENYGKSSSRWAEPVFQLCGVLGTTDVLDYGCGKGELNLHLPFSIQCYDPAIPKHAKPPTSAEIVVCTDVLEHVEPEYLEEVLADLQRLTVRVLFLNVATRPAMKTLADGRNAHLIVEPWDWWKPKIELYFEVDHVEVQEGEFTLVAKRRH